MPQDTRPLAAQDAAMDFEMTSMDTDDADFTIPDDDDDAQQQEAPTVSEDDAKLAAAGLIDLPDAAPTATAKSADDPSTWAALDKSSFSMCARVLMAIKCES